MIEYNENPAVVYELLKMRAVDGAVLTAEQIQQIDYSVGYGWYHIYENRLKAPVGYVVWAYVNDETIRRLVNHGKLPKRRYEWWEGVITLVLDFQYRGAGVRPLPRLVLEAFPGNIERAAFVRRGRVNLYRRLGRGMTKVSLDQFLV